MNSFARCERNVLPLHVVELARQMPKGAFAATFEGQPLLLVRVKPTATELLAGLAEAGTASSDRLMPTIGLETEIAERPSSPPSFRLSPVPPSRPPHTPARLQAVLARGLHHVVAVVKRAGMGRPYEERVTVGRTRHSDIVLRDPNVSKFHAWFECDERDRYFVFDANSRNGTLVEGERVTPQTPVELPFGAEVQFGSITAVLTTPEVLWEAFEAYRPVRIAR
ncbi:MAG: FHA domain-containing protein [Polyangiaceae bacterium]